jgi:hypothetical protein
LLRWLVIASAAKQSSAAAESLDCFVALLFAMTNFVIAGLDPAIHAASPRVRRLSMDHRVKPGGDEGA